MQENSFEKIVDEALQIVSNKVLKKYAFFLVFMSHGFIPCAAPLKVTHLFSPKVYKNKFKALLPLRYAYAYNPRSRAVAVFYAYR